jgi:hypothetical protein
MIASHARPAAGRLSLAVLSIALTAGAGAPFALAQNAAPPAGDEVSAAVGQPVVLTPPTLLFPEPDSDLPAEPQAGDALPSPEGIEVNRLAEIDPDAVGTLDSEAGGFGPDLWQGSDRRTVERLLPRMPGAGRSATMRNLSRRLLLSNAVPPASRSGESAGNLLALRIDRLAALGDFAGLNDLLAIVPQRYDDETVARARVESRLLQGDPTGACQEVRYGVSVHQDADYWRKALVFCQIVAGEVDQATLGVALLREEGQSEDPTFFQLADQLTGIAPGSAAADPISPLHFAMLQASGQPLPKAVLKEASPGLLVSLASTPGSPLVQRARAAERAVSLGLLSPVALSEIYLEFPFEADTLTRPISAAQELDGLKRRALLYQAALGQNLPAARAEILDVALDADQAGEDYILATQVFLPLVEEIPVQREFVWFAGTAGRALYAAGRFEAAGTWFTLARQESLLSPEAAGAVSRLWPYTRLSAHEAGTWEGNLAAWTDAQAGSPADDLAARRLVLRAAFQALGESDSMDWSDLIGTAPAAPKDQAAPDAALMLALSEASETGRLGETVLLALLALGEAGPGGSHSLAFYEALAALNRVGLETEARMLAIEAALDNGV